MFVFCPFFPPQFSLPVCAPPAAPLRRARALLSTWNSSSAQETMQMRELSDDLYDSGSGKKNPEI